MQVTKPDTPNLLFKNDHLNQTYVMELLFKCYKYIFKKVFILVLGGFAGYKLFTLCH